MVNRLLMNLNKNFEILIIVHNSIKNTLIEIKMSIEFFFFALACHSEVNTDCAV